MIISLENQRKIIKIMRISMYQIVLAVLFITVAQAHDGKAQEVLEKKISLQIKDENISEALEKIEIAAGVHFVYQKNTFKENSVVSVDSKNSKLINVLQKLLTPLEVEYLVSKDQIVLKKQATKTETTALQELNSTNKPFDLKVSGTVLDEKGQPLTGVTVVVKGGTTNTVANPETTPRKSATTGAITDLDGKFTIDVADENSVLIFSYLGFLTQEAVVGSQTAINITMKEDVQTLDEVVAIGYGTIQKSNVNSAISSVNANALTERPVADAAQALQGKVAGVSITQNSGAPGGTGGTSIRIRGISSISSTNNPLIVLDGFPLPDQNADNVLNTFSPNEIERIDVLKDAGAVAIYGVRGSNGVIMITTKRGLAGKTNVNVNFYQGYQEVWRLPAMANAREYATLNNEARIASGLAPFEKLVNPSAVESQFGQGTDWLNSIFRGAAQTSLNINMQSGTDKFKYSLSAGYFKQDGIILNSDYERFSLRFNGDLNVSKKFKVGNSISMNRTSERPVNTYDPFNSVILLAMTSPPTVLARNPDGTYAGGDGSEGFAEPNPLYILETQTDFKNVRYRMTGSVFAEFEIIKNLKFKALGGLDFLMSNQRGFNPNIRQTGGRPVARSSAFESTNFNPSYLSDLTLNYEKKFGKHDLSAVIGYSVQDNHINYLGAGRTGYTRNDLRGFGAYNPVSLDEISNYGGFLRNSLESYFARANYNFNDKYLLTGSIRFDGSSNFGPENKYAFFPAVSFAWRAINEKFINDLNIKVLSDLKFRTSYGASGNSNIGAFTYLSLLSNSDYAFGLSNASNGSQAATAPTRLANPKVGWEKNIQFNVGVDVGLFNNRVQLQADFYNRVSSDFLLYVAPPAIAGVPESSPYNTGNMTNNGMDLSLNTINLDTKGLKWTTNVVIGTYVNKVTSLGLGQPINTGFARIQGGGLRTEVGQPVNYFYGYKTEGIFQNQAEIDAHAVQTAGNDPSTSTAPGDIKFKDVNGDGVIDADDRTNIGNSNPTFVYGLTNALSYSNKVIGSIDLSIFLQGSQGNKVLNFNKWYNETGVSNGNYSKEYLGRWTGEGTSNSIPRAILNDPNRNNYVSDRFVEDASYLRVRNVRLAWTLPANWSKVVSIGKFQIYGSVQNLLTFTQYKGLDPEVGGGIDIGFYPQARTWTVGVNVDF
ncbi:MAG: SusC/RagA family TonB-linked outer membrane protein [Cytophagales bacterium]